ALRARAAEARRLVSKTLAEMRELSHLLRPSTLDDLGLVPSLDSHLQAFADRHQIATSFTAEGLPERLPAEIETALYRITQEALTNVAKHAAAHRVRVTLVREGGELRLEIADDGHGLPAHPGGTRPGTGLVGRGTASARSTGRSTLASDPDARQGLASISSRRLCRPRHGLRTIHRALHARFRSRRETRSRVDFVAPQLGRGLDRDRPADETLEGFDAPPLLLGQEGRHLGMEAQRDARRVLRPGGLALHAAERIVGERLERSQAARAAAVR